MAIGIIYLQVIQKRFKQVKDQGEKAMAQLNDNEIHWKPNEVSNSVAVIVKHMSGNMHSRWKDFLTTDGEKSDRNRDQEFVDTIATNQEMFELWEKGWEVLFTALNHLHEHDLEKHISIRGEALVIIDAIERQLAHYASHVGQILYISKQLKGDTWQTLSIPKGKSEAYLRGDSLNS
ncbi:MULTISPECIES: DUF1572 family protein [Virgibacillus]|uniref:DUF1572 domain-containing protein n=2 Tax=Virgibacillus TaxID=84406 RepID=A0A024Q7T3_9BACI|nr:MULTISPECIES: DUF1572 family protein [Virgibacillus]EQB38144.1 hypothetical protein M948_06100 [Virgibacillus sp. CM-4]MYL40850.1 DUF1572 domain-containing protein [Virgibacillus massiliensis]GGJ52325.1 hypothetical protein GCM10007111_13050 [Virgibacillus kapii]CDQ38352.1 hypothetical protein BN990_00622 [Virgibacillus massiliensis]